MSRYIDGYELFNNVTTCYRCATGEARKSYRNVLDMICDADNKDVEEVKHGKWSFDEDECVATCTVCKTVYEDRGDTIVDYWDFCPHCGAKMDKEKEE